jgi:ketosteroid isomerase-like protein
METTDNESTRSVVRGYHLGWTSGSFEDAVRLLAPDLTVEVPINAYPTRESFARALVGFGSLVKSTTLLAEFVRGTEAMLLYDMEVDRVGTMRIAEHFTVADGRITRLRQIHDTAALRAAGLVPAQ